MVEVVLFIYLLILYIGLFCLFIIGKKILINLIIDFYMFIFNESFPPPEKLFINSICIMSASDEVVCN